MFLRASAVAGGGFLLGAYAQPLQAQRSQQSGPGALRPEGELVPADFISIATDGTVTIMARNPETGQHSRNMLPMIVADELDVEWSQVKVAVPDADAKYGVQFTGGSTATPTNWNPMRQLGAAARQMLLAAAAERWQVPVGECSTKAGRVLHAASQRSLGYGELAAQAAAQPVPALKSVRLKEAKEYRIIGTTTIGADTKAIVQGKPLFGIDVTLPGMLYAVYEKCPVYGGRPLSADLEAVKAVKGVKEAFLVEGKSAAGKFINFLNDDPGLEPGVAIVAESWWAAQSARKKLNVKWDFGPYGSQESGAMAKQAAALAQQAPARTLRKEGDAEGALQASGVKVVESTYVFPFIAHAPLEPQNCTAHFQNGKLEVWSTSQTPQNGRTITARALGMNPADITIHMVRGGGGFGRRLYNDYMAEAAYISRAVKAPVKLLWSREDDMQHDYYRAGGLQSLKAGVDASGKLVAWQNHFIGYGEGETFTHSGQLDPNEFPARFVPNFLMQSTVMPLGLRTGALRAPRSNVYAWVFQSFLDELALTAGKDPVAFRLELLRSGPPAGTPGVMDAGRMAAVVQLAAEKSGWGKRKLPKGTAMGIGFYYSHRGYFAEVAEVTVSADKRVKVNKVWVAGDIGSQVINAGASENQTQGAIIDGMSEMLQEITLRNGRVAQGNFHQHPLVTMAQAPKQIEVHFLKSNNPPTGLGEPALPPILPAIANAIFAATGERIRTMPMTKQGFRFA